MSISERLSTQIRQSIVAQISERSTSIQGLSEAGAVAQLGESFKIYLLTLTAIKTRGDSLAECIVDTGRWHHQVYVGDQPDSAVASVADQPGAADDHQVVAISQSALPAALKSTIDWIDAHVADASTADLLMVPDYLLTAVWLHGVGPESVVIAVMASPIENLSINTLIDPSAFLQALRASPPIAGLPPLREGDG